MRLFFNTFITVETGSVDQRLPPQPSLLTTRQRSLVPWTPRLKAVVFLFLIVLALTTWYCVLLLHTCIHHAQLCNQASSGAAIYYLGLFY